MTIGNKGLARRTLIQGCQDSRAGLVGRSRENDPLSRAFQQPPATGGKPSQREILRELAPTTR